MQTILSYLKNDSIVKIKGVFIVGRQNYNILVVPNTGAWTTASYEDMDIIEKKLNNTTIETIKDSGSEHIKKLFNDLLYSGVISIDEKNITQITKYNNNITQANVQQLPQFVVLKYTNACNLRCSYCYSYDKKQREINSIPNEYVYKLVELLNTPNDKHKTNICFHGGEPLIRFNAIVQCVNHLKEVHKDGVEFSIQTNGTLLNSKIAKFLKNEDFSVGISLDGYDIETNRLRPFANNRTSIQPTINSIKKCVEEGITPGVISVMTNVIHKNIVEYLEQISSYGVKAFHFNNYFPSGRGEGRNYSLTEEELLDARLKIILFINDYNDNKPLDKQISERYTRNLIRSLIRNGHSTYMCAQSPCGSGRRIITLMPNGDLFPCDDFCTLPQFKIGNVNTITDLKKTLLESTSVQLCQSHHIDNIPKCKECIWRKICISHCCSDSYFFTGHFQSPHSTCEFIKKFIPTVIDLLYTGRIQIENLIN